MALTGSLGSYFQAWKLNPKHQTPQLVDVFQTSGSGATSGVLSIVAAASSSDEYHITYLGISSVDPTAASLSKVCLATTVLAQLPTASTAPVSFSFGEIGIVCGTTTTATVSVLSSGGTVTTYFVCQGYKLI